METREWRFRELVANAAKYGDDSSTPVFSVVMDQDQRSVNILFNGHIHQHAQMLSRLKWGMLSEFGETAMTHQTELAIATNVQTKMAEMITTGELKRKGPGSWEYTPVPWWWPDFRR